MHHVGPCSGQEVDAKCLAGATAGKKGWTDWGVPWGAYSEASQWQHSAGHPRNAERTLADHPCLSPLPRSRPTQDPCRGHVGVRRPLPARVLSAACDRPPTDGRVWAVSGAPMGVIFPLRLHVGLQWLWEEH